MTHTIFAQSSAPGKAGVALFRLSGPLSRASLSKLITHQRILEPRKLYLRKIYMPNQARQLIDEAVVVFFEKNASFTGEESVEIYTHGSLAVIKLMHQALSSIEGVRMAEPGEFAKRAFLNGNMDLTAAEGLSDLIEAETELQHKQAIRQFSGELAEIYEGWRQNIVKLIALLEAYIDFPDEDIPEETLKQVEQEVKNLSSAIKEHLSDSNRGERLRSGIKLAILGKPNAGKSSLINQIAGRDLAIVSDIAGTTRDVIESYIDIAGYPLILQDTAGINLNSQDKIEQFGIDRAWSAANNSDIKLIIVDIQDNIADSLALFEDIIDKNTIIILNKVDLGQIDSSILANNDLAQKAQAIITTSIKQNVGLDDLSKQIALIAERIAAPTDSPAITRARYRAQLEQALESLARFSLNQDLVLAAEDLRLTTQAISNITGKITVDEVLGEIFGNFCIGK